MTQLLGGDISCSEIPSCHAGCRDNWRKLSTNCRMYRKKLYLCNPFEEKGMNADVAQLARARDL